MNDKKQDFKKQNDNQVLQCTHASYELSKVTPNCKIDVDKYRIWKCKKFKAISAEEILNKMKINGKTISSDVKSIHGTPLTTCKITQASIGPAKS